MLLSGGAQSSGEGLVLLADCAVTRDVTLVKVVLPRDAMLAPVLAMALCLSVSVCHKSVF